MGPRPVFARRKLTRVPTFGGRGTRTNAPPTAQIGGLASDVVGRFLDLIDAKHDGDTGRKTWMVANKTRVLRCLATGAGDDEGEDFSIAGST